MARFLFALALIATITACGGSSSSSTTGDPAECAAGESVSRACGAAGTETRSCVGGKWGAWSTCQEPPPACEVGESVQRACGNCGTQVRTCVEGAWGEWSACEGQGECAAGREETAECGPALQGTCHPGTMARTCSATCQWSVWGACEGAVKPSAEVCGNGLDENCNGQADEGCTCSPAALGAGGSFPLSTPVTKLIAHPERCLVYALNAGTAATPAEVIVIDTGKKQELTRIPLPRQATDFDLSPDGKTMVVAHDAVRQVSIIDPLTFQLTRTVPVTSDPYAIEVSDAGRALYAEYDQWCDIRAIDLSTGADGLLNSWGNYAPDIELSRDGRFLFAGEAGISGGTLTKYDVSGATATAVDASTWDDGYGFPYPARYVYLGPGGQHIHYAGYELDAGNLRNVLGRIGERVFAEDAAGTFAIGATEVYDTRLVKPVFALAAPVSAAALAAKDTELWTYGAGKLSYMNVGDLVDPATLGQRELDPEPLSAYTLSVLVADPVRPRLYGLDATRDLVVAIDRETLTPLRAILVASSPADLDVDPDGSALYVGHLGALSIARIDLASFSFDRFIPTPRRNVDIEVLAHGRLATIDDDQWTTPTVIDIESGQVLDALSWGAYQGALAATADGASLFVGESGISGGNVVRYDVSTGKLLRVAKSDYDHGYGFPYPAHSVVAVPDGTGVYYAGHLLEGAHLTQLLYLQADPIRSVTPDGRLATSATTVYRVSDGAALGPLSVAGAVQAVSPDGATLYVAGSGAIGTVDLTGF